jgi:hypothetical protein
MVLSPDVVKSRGGRGRAFENLDLAGLGPVTSIFYVSTKDTTDSNNPAHVGSTVGFQTSRFCSDQPSGSP